MCRANMPQLAHIVIKKTVVAAYRAIKRWIRPKVIDDQVQVALEHLS